MLTRIRPVGFLLSTVLAAGLAGCGGKSEPQFSDQQKQQMKEQMERQYQEKMGGMKPGMSKEDMMKAMEKYKEQQKGK